MKTGSENIRRRTDGRWEARIVIDTPKNGKTSYKYLYGKTYDEVLGKKQEFLLEERQKGASYRQTLLPRKAVRIPAAVEERSAADSGQKGTDGYGAYAGDTSGYGTQAGESGKSRTQAGETGQCEMLTGNSGTGKEKLSQNVGGVYQESPKAAAASQDDGCAEDTALFRYAAAEWLHYKETIVRESTYVYYTAMIRNQLLPQLGGIALTEITSDFISDFLNAKKEHGRREDNGPLAIKTVSDIKVILKQVLKYANEKNLIEVVPSCPAVTVRQKKIHVLTRQEQRRVEEEALARDNSFTLGILLSLYGGLRIGEVCALKWGDFDFRNGTVRVTKTVTRLQNLENGKKAGTKIIIGRPKTDCSLRVVPLPETVLQYFKERRGADETYLLTGTEKLMEPRACLGRFKRLLKKCGLADHTWHSLRHTFATRCVESGVDIKSLSEIMGHSDVEITMQRYVHPSLDTKKEQVNKLTCFGQER